MKRIAVLMTVHNRRKKTLRCLECLYANIVPEGYGVEVYMTDDGCTDGTPEAVKERFADVYIIKGDGNLYWNRGMWIAWNEAAKKTFDFYLWLNDDTFIYSDVLATMIGLSNNYDDNAIVVGATENAERTEMTYGGYVEGLRQKPQGRPIEVEYFNGNVVLIPRTVFQKLGNLDYYFRHSKGDFDYGVRARKARIKMIQAPLSAGICEHHLEMAEWCNPDIAFYYRWKALIKPNGMPPKEVFYFCKKQYGIAKACVHTCSVILRCMFPKLYLILE